jgi:hypothetical protein
MKLSYTQGLKQIGYAVHYLLLPFPLCWFLSHDFTLTMRVLTNYLLRNWKPSDHILRIAVNFLLSDLITTLCGLSGFIVKCTPQLKTKLCEIDQLNLMFLDIVCYKIVYVFTSCVVQCNMSTLLLWHDMNDLLPFFVSVTLKQLVFKKQ